MDPRPTPASNPDPFFVAVRGAEWILGDLLGDILGRDWDVNDSEMMDHHRFLRHRS